MPPKRKYTYRVMAKAFGGRSQRVMLRTNSRQEATAFFKKHPRATHIQRYTGKITSGVFQPGVKNSIRRNGRVYKKAYEGPHTKKFAQKLARGFRKDGFPAITTSSKRGSFLYVNFDKLKRRRR